MNFTQMLPHNVTQEHTQLQEREFPLLQLEQVILGGQMQMLLLNLLQIQQFQMERILETV